MTAHQIKEEIKKVQATEMETLEYDYEKLNKLRFRYEYLQMQLQALHMLDEVESIESMRQMRDQNQDTYASDSASDTGDSIEE